MSLGDVVIVTFVVAFGGFMLGVPRPVLRWVVAFVLVALVLVFGRAAPSVAAGPTVKRRVMGQAATLRAFDDTRLRIRPYQILDPLVWREGDEAGEPILAPAGMRYMAVQLSVRNVGQRPTRGWLSLGAQLWTRGGSVITPQYVFIDGCDVIEPMTIPVGEVVRGCIVFKVRVSARPGKFVLALNRGYGPQVGRWEIPRG